MIGASEENEPTIIIAYVRNCLLPRGFKRTESFRELRSPLYVETLHCAPTAG